MCRMCKTEESMSNSNDFETEFCKRQTTRSDLYKQP